MSLFTRGPLGITCQLNPDAYDGKISVKEWADLLTDQHVRVRMVRSVGEDLCQVTFPACPMNQPILDSLRKKLEKARAGADASNNGEIEFKFYFSS